MKKLSPYDRTSGSKDPSERIEPQETIVAVREISGGGEATSPPWRASCVESAEGRTRRGERPTSNVELQNGSELVIIEHGPITDRVLIYHKIARSCGAYAVFYGAMAGQELIALRQKVGTRKFQPTLEESMPWLARSTAYLYIGYAEKFEARLAAICPTAGQIELKALPDPRDYEAAERTELFAQVRESTGADSVEQMWLALGLMKEANPRGGHHPRKKERRNLSEDEIALEEAQIFWLPLQQKIFELTNSKAKDRLLYLPISAPHQEASLSLLENQLGSLCDLVREALRQKRKAAKS